MKLVERTAGYESIFHYLAITFLFVLKCLKGALRWKLVLCKNSRDARSTGTDS